MAGQRDEIIARIQAFNAAKGGGVIVRKAAKGYSLYQERTGKPVARLRPTSKGDQVEVMWWRSSSERWDQIGDFGPMVMPLDDALKYVARDPMGCFWR